MKKNQKTKIKKFNNIKKSIKAFILDEDGFVSRENILAIGLATISALGVLASISNSYSAHSSHGSHGSSNFLVDEPVTGTHCYRIVGTHTNHPSHASHDSY